MADVGYTNDDGIKANLDSITGKAATPIGGGKLRLFKNNVVVSKTTLLAALTESTFAGYAAITLASASWGAASVAANLASSSYGGSTVFTRSTSGATENVYGWYITDAGNTKLYACANLAGAPIPLTNAGDSVTISPSLTEASAN